MHKLIHTLANIIYPRRCPGCDMILNSDDMFLCEKCIKRLHFYKERTCYKCGRPIKSRYEVVCAECASGKFCFDEAVAPFPYTEMIKEALVRFKYGHRPEYASFFAACIWSYAKKRIEIWKPQMIISIPVHKDRLNKRGYNQAALIAEKLSQFSKIPFEEEVIIRHKKTVAQKELGSTERRKNMAEAFSYIYQGRLPERILAVDDIFTTGSTVDVTAELLKRNGAASVYIVTVAN